jgi:amino acid transporter
MWQVSAFDHDVANLMIEPSLGWLSTMAWQAGVGSGAFLAGTVTQQLIQINQPNYDAPAWQGTLFVIGVSCILFIMNVWGTRALPMLQNVLLILNVFGFSAVVIIFWVLARVQPARVVFTQFENFGGWSSMGLSLMVGQISSVFALICAFARSRLLFVR